MFDEQRISSIVQNLAMNAIKFSNKGGEIRIVAQFADEESQEELIIGVEDNGIGMTD